MTGRPDRARFRWLVLAVFVLSTAINYLDRQTLATLTPLVRAEFHLSRAEYGWILGVFSITYAASAPFAGMLIDAIGLNRAVSMAVGVWSCAGIATGFTSGFAGLLGCRSALGVAEAAGIPSAGKAIHQFLKPAERALGNAVNQAGVSLGAVLAPPIATWIAVHYGWRQAFAATGVAGLAWIPLWHWVAPRAAAPVDKFRRATGTGILRDRRLWAFVAANALSMVGYSLWTNWTTQYLVDAHHLTVGQSVRYAWIPPVAAMAGGFVCGWLSLWLMNRGAAALAARFRVSLAMAVVSLATAAIPLAHSPAAACGLICVSIFAVAGFSVNTYTLPLDAFGRDGAAFAVSMLVSSYGVAQLVISPLFGALIDRYGYAPVTTISALTPLAACLVLWESRSVR